MTPYQESLMPAMLAAVKADVQAIVAGSLEPSIVAARAAVRSASDEPVRDYFRFCRGDLLTMKRMREADKTWRQIAGELGHPVASCKTHYYRATRAAE